MGNKPLVSFCILAYNQEKYIEEAVISALNQDYELMEIIISDDKSQDSTVKKVKQLCNGYSGSHKIKINVNDKNLGIKEHCNKVLYELAEGDIILLAGGDDISLPDRTSKYVEFFNRYPNLMSISCKSKEVDEEGRALDDSAEWDGTYTLFNINDYIEHRDFIIYSGDSRGLRREVIDKFPPIKYPRAEDIYLFIRSLLIGTACYIREPLVLRRNHSNNASKVRTKHYDDFEKQTMEDIEYAYKHNYISEIKKNNMMKKVLHVKEVFELYWNSPFSGIKPFFYRVLSRMFKVKKYGD